MGSSTTLFQRRIGLNSMYILRTICSNVSPQQATCTPWCILRWEARPFFFSEVVFCASHGLFPFCGEALGTIHQEERYFFVFVSALGLNYLEMGPCTSVKSRWLRTDGYSSERIPPYPRSLLMATVVSGAENPVEAARRRRNGTPSLVNRGAGWRSDPLQKSQTREHAP